MSLHVDNMQGIIREQWYYNDSLQEVLRSVHLVKMKTNFLQNTLDSSPHQQDLLLMLSASRELGVNNCLMNSFMTKINSRAKFWIFLFVLFHFVWFNDTLLYWRLLQLKICTGRTLLGQDISKIWQLKFLFSNVRFLQNILHMLAWNAEYPFYLE